MRKTHSLIKYDFKTLSKLVDGSGRATMFWDGLRKGLDPIADFDKLGISFNLKTLFSRLERRKNIVSETVSNLVVSDCGARKFLVRLNDGLSVECVLIPSLDNSRTTLSLSSQVGCDRGCKFCFTGNMGLVRNLSGEEILAQVVHGIRMCRRHEIPPITNIVFNGMGEPAKNLFAVSEAITCMSDNKRFNFSPNKILFNTVGPSVDSFERICELPCLVSWSVHTVSPEIRERLVPSSKYTDLIDLRDALLKGLAKRTSSRGRDVMIAITLMKGVNDSHEDMTKLVEFLQPFKDVCNRIIVELIPFNETHSNEIELKGQQIRLRPPDHDTLITSRDFLLKNGFVCLIYYNRGFQDSAGFGMLATNTSPTSSRG